MEYTVHHVLIDSAHRDATQPNWEYTALLGNEGALRHVVAVSLLGCVIPHADSNVRADACRMYLREYYHSEGTWRYVTASVMPGYYATLDNYRAAIRAALARAERAPPLTSANDQPEYDLVYYENSHAALRINDKSPTTNPRPASMATSKSGALVSFALALDMDRRTPLYRLGFDARHELYTADASDIDATRALFVSNRLVDISTTDYVDIDIPELPDAALKMTTQTRRVFARVPTARSGTRTVYDLTDRNVIRRHFFPVQMWRVTVRLFDQFGLPFANNDADHTLDLEIVTVNHALPSELRWQPRRAATAVEALDEDESPPPPPPPPAPTPSATTAPPPTTLYIAGGAAIGGALALAAAVAAWRRWRRPTRSIDAAAPSRGAFT